MSKSKFYELLAQAEKRNDFVKDGQTHTWKPIANYKGGKLMHTSSINSPSSIPVHTPTGWCGRWKFRKGRTVHSNPEINSGKGGNTGQRPKGNSRARHPLATKLLPIACASMSDASPTEQPQIVSLRMTPEQVRSLAPILARQRGRKEGALLSVTSFSYEPVAGGAGREA